VVAPGVDELVGDELVEAADGLRVVVLASSPSPVQAMALVATTTPTITSARTRRTITFLTVLSPAAGSESAWR
jgi:hypothetical protein